MITNQVFYAIYQETGVSVAELKSKTRKREVVDARHMFCEITKKNTKLSLKNIGSCIGNRDHSTVLNSLTRHQEFMQSDKNYRATFNAIIMRLHPVLTAMENEPHVMTSQELDKRIDRLKKIIFSPEVIDSEYFRPYKQELNKLLDLKSKYNENPTKTI
jgi:hypothetical protein